MVSICIFPILSERSQQRRQCLCGQTVPNQTTIAKRRDMPLQSRRTTYGQKHVFSNMADLNAGVKYCLKYPATLARNWLNVTLRLCKICFPWPAFSRGSCQRWRCSWERAPRSLTRLWRCGSLGDLDLVGRKKPQQTKWSFIRAPL